MIKLLFVVVALAISHASFAGTEVANGGKGIEIDGKIYLLDLVETGYERTPYFNNAVAADPSILMGVARIFKHETFPRELIARKLTEIRKIDPSSAILLLKAMDLYYWRIVDESFVQLRDHRAVIDRPYITVAARVETAVLINRAAWSRMTAENRAALVFHEIIYALAVPSKKPERKRVQPVAPVQEMTGWLFTPEIADYPSLSENGFYKNVAIHAGLPELRAGSPARPRDLMRIQHGKGFLQMARGLFPKEFIDNSLWVWPDEPEALNVPNVIGFNFQLAKGNYRSPLRSDLDFEGWIGEACGMFDGSTADGFFTSGMLQLNYWIVELGYYNTPESTRRSFVTVRNGIFGPASAAGAPMAGQYPGCVEQLRAAVRPSLAEALKAWPVSRASLKKE